MKNKFWILIDSYIAQKKGLSEINKRQHSRLSEIIKFARNNSPYYKELYKNLPEKIEDIRLLPVTNKQKLMEHFNEWVTDRDVKLNDILSFINNPDNIGEKFMKKYMVATTSGTTGNYGIYLKDDYDITVGTALNIRNTGKWLGARDAIKFLTTGKRTAAVIATNGHFVGISTLEFMKKMGSLFKPDIKILSVHAPIPELVSQLNQFKPAILTGYGGVISILAHEQSADRLKINPVLILPVGEAMTKEEYKRISKIFNSKIRDFYGSTECIYLSCDCEEGWYHINSDWVIVEAVDKDYQPVKPGIQSYTVLISNLVNHVQPVLRYDLGDSIMMRPDKCPCGNPHPAIRVQGRSSDVLNFLAEDGEQVSILPLVLVTLLLSVSGIKTYQLIQTSLTNLRMRMITNDDVDSDQVWQIVHTKLSDLFKKNKLNLVNIERGEEPIEQTVGGKYRSIIPLNAQK